MIDLTYVDLLNDDHKEIKIFADYHENLAIICNINDFFVRKMKVWRSNVTKGATYLFLFTPFPTTIFDACNWFLLR